MKTIKKLATKKSQLSEIELKLKRLRLQLKNAKKSKDKVQEMRLKSQIASPEEHQLGVIS